MDRTTVVRTARLADVEALRPALAKAWNKPVKVTRREVVDACVEFAASIVAAGGTLPEPEAPYKGQGSIRTPRKRKRPAGQQPDEASESAHEGEARGRTT